MDYSYHERFVHDFSYNSWTSRTIINSHVHKVAIRKELTTYFPTTQKILVICQLALFAYGAPCTLTSDLHKHNHFSITIPLF